MPLFRREGRNPEDAPGSGDPAQNPAHAAQVRTHRLTEELLDWLIAALEAVIKTPQVQQVADRRAHQAMRDALKYADHLYPLTLEGHHAHQVREGEGVVLGEQGAVQEPGEGS